MSQSYLPQSQTDLVIAIKDQGVVIFNTTKGSYELDTTENSVYIPRTQFKDLFRTLLIQAGQASGRTAPEQHVEILNAVERVLKSN
jgi:hypothetical protein